MMEFETIVRIFACIALIFGAVECFAGFKIIKAMIIIWGFFIGAMIGVGIATVTNSSVLGIVCVLLLGLGIAILSYKMYFVGIYVLTAFLTAIFLYLAFENIWVSLSIAICVGALAVCFVKPVAIASTAFAGAEIILASAYIMMNLDMKANPAVMVILWIPITFAGICIQYFTTQNVKGTHRRLKSKAKSANSSMTYSERKYPGMQRAYRNFCIKCGCELIGEGEKCPRCGFAIED